MSISKELHVLKQAVLEAVAQSFQQEMYGTSLIPWLFLPFQTLGMSVWDAYLHEQIKTAVAPCNNEVKQ